MKALRHTAWKTLPEFQDVETPTPKEGEVLIKMCGAGVCHSDLHIIHHFDDEVGGVAPPPYTLGHENAGYIEQLGSGVKGFELGQAVVVHPSAGCGLCSYCHSDNEVYCGRTRTSTPGLGNDGGMAEYLLVDSARHLIALGDVKPWLAAPMTDAGLTSYHAVKSALSVLTPVSYAVVIGVGGLGHMAVQFLRELTATTIIAVDSSSDALVMAKELGADYCLPSDENTLDAILELTEGIGAHAVFDFVGIQATMDVAKSATRSLGVLHVVGLGQGRIDWCAGEVAWEAPVSTHLGGTHEDLREIVSLMTRGKIHAESELYHLSDALEVLDKLAKGQVRGRAVLMPDDFDLSKG